MIKTTSPLACEISFATKFFVDQLESRIGSSKYYVRGWPTL
jgi:hypothetical protein